MIERGIEMNNETSIRILVVDDHPITRTGIAAILREEPGMEVCAQAGGVTDAVRLFEEHDPDLTLMDLRLPDGHGVEAIQRIRLKNPNARIIVLTTYEGDEDIHQALQAGAMGYLIKGMTHDVLVQAILRVHHGIRFLPPPVTQALSLRSPGSELSRREREVLKLIVAGKSNREIGEELHIKEATVKSHINVILMRLKVSDRTQAAIEALRRGLEHL
jgi:DNA-binding NarL/FixJ family response regulator